LALCRSSPIAHLLKYLHDARLVRHLKFKAWSMVFAILVSWGIAFVEYCSRSRPTGSSMVYSPAELKSIQEVITLIVFAGFTAIYLREPLTLIRGAGFALIGLGAVLVFKGNL
jgi:uncharacterized protein